MHTVRTLTKKNRVTVTFIQGVTPPEPDWALLHLLDNGWIEFAYDDTRRHRYSPTSILRLKYDCF